MTAGIKTLEIMDRPGQYEYLDKITGKLINGLLDAAREAGHKVCGGHINGALHLLTLLPPCPTPSKLIYTHTVVCRNLQSLLLLAYRSQTLAIFANPSVTCMPVYCVCGSDRQTTSQQPLHVCLNAYSAVRMSRGGVCCADQEASIQTDFCQSICLATKTSVMLNLLCMQACSDSSLQKAQSHALRKQLSKSTWKSSADSTEAW